MNHQKMWYELKESLMAEVNTTDERRKALVMDTLLEMNSIEIKEQKNMDTLKLEAMQWQRKEREDG